MAGPPLKEWKIKLPVLSNKLLWKHLLMTCFLSTVPLLLLLVSLNLYEGYWQDIATSFKIWAIVATGFTLALVTICLVIFGRGIPTRYCLTEPGIEQHTESKIGKLSNRLGLLGLLTGTTAGLTAAGAGLIAYSRETIAVDWKEVERVVCLRGSHQIILENDWRTIMQIYCPQNYYDSLLQWISKKTNKEVVENISKTVQNGPTPTAHKVIITLFIIIFGLMLFPELPVRFVGLFTLLLIPATLLAVWTDGEKKKRSAISALIIIALGIGMAFYMGEVNLYSEGANYALAVEIVLLGFFAKLNLGVLLRWLR